MDRAASSSVEGMNAAAHVGLGLDAALDQAEGAWRAGTSLLVTGDVGSGKTGAVGGVSATSFARSPGGGVSATSFARSPGPTNR